MVSSRCSSLFRAVVALVLLGGVWAPTPRAKSRNQQSSAGRADVVRRDGRGPGFREWLEEDVPWIITTEERAAFNKLKTDEERDQFIEQFWSRRDPTPDTEENEYKDEHYRRIVYANERFAEPAPGWKTDRGRKFIMYGRPDEFSAETVREPHTGEEFPGEVWRYRYLEGVGQDVKLTFVDTCRCGEYHLTLDRAAKDALLTMPNGLLPDTSQAERAHQPILQLWVKGFRPPPIKFKDLEEIVTHKIGYSQLPFAVRADFVKATSFTNVVPITIQIRNQDLTFKPQGNAQRANVNLFGRVTTVTGWVVQTFEDTLVVQTPADALPATREKNTVYWKLLPLRVGTYTLDLVLQDRNGDRLGTHHQLLRVPEVGEGLSASSLILADRMETVPAKNWELGGNFAIGSTRIRPQVGPSDGHPPSFSRTGGLNFWLQVYNFAVDPASHKASTRIEYDIVNTGTKKPVVHMAETSEGGQQITLKKTVPLTTLAPGAYRLRVTVRDNLAKKTITPVANLRVE